MDETGVGEGFRRSASRWGAAALCLLALAPAGCDGRGDGPPAREGGGAADTAEAVAAGQDTAELREVNRFLSYAPADSMAELALWAGFGGANSAWNFDGYYGGNATVVVPAGWRVEVTYRTLDANVPHSAAIVETRETIPVDGGGVDVAFPGASTPSFLTGLSSTHKPVEFSFRADEPGRYWIFCGVPGHARAGMWIWFEVSEAAEAPDFRTEGEG